MLHLLNKFFKNKIILSIFMLVAFSQITNAQLLGQTTVDPNSTHNYTFNDGVIHLFFNWQVVGGTITYTEAVGNFYLVTVLWGAAGSGSVTARSRVTVLDTINVTIGASAPATPDMPTITNYPGYTVLTRGNPPSGETWYWQSSSTGTSTSNSSTSVTMTSGTVYYLRSYDSSTSQWSESRTINYTVDPPPGGLSNENYIHTIIPRIESTNVSTLSDDQKIESVTYFDGLGRPMQSIGIHAGNNNEDIITHLAYDEYGRQDKDYLSYATTSNGGLYRTDALSATESFYLTKFPNELNVVTPNPFSEKLFEDSPLNRVLKQAAPGEDWKLGNGHEIEFDYQTNTNTEVRRYEVTLTESIVNNIITYIPTLVLDTSSNNNNGYYNANELYKTIIYDENHTTGIDHSVEEFKDKQGRVLLKRAYNSGVAHDTYYVYDNYGNLSYVLPPKSEPHAAKPDVTEMDELCYQYKYDHRNRLVEKKIPGKGDAITWEEIVYNKLDQPIMTRDPNLKSQGEWLVTKYDAFGRVVYTAIKNSSTSRTSFQNTFDNDNTATQYEKKVSSGTGYLNTYYSSTARPTSVDEILTINYYDNYTFDIGSGVSETSGGVTPITDARGLATGSKVRVLDSSPVKWITTVSYYDQKSRPIYLYSFNDYLGTTDKVKSEFDFVGSIDKTTTTHTKSGNTLTAVDTFTYDDSGRLKKQTQKINSLADETIVENTYDELGQLINKGVGGDSTQSRLQTVDYTYNIRGWLKQINNTASLGNDLFAFKLNYNSADHSGIKLYNGNIAETEWKTDNDNVLRWYRYGYDALNRINSATNNSSNYNLSNVSYDKNGNITNLTRRGHTNSGATSFGDMDILIYTYQQSGKSNQLEKVLDNGNDTYGFKDGINTTTEYTYDSNGNMLKDLNKGINTNITYNHLNLPTQVTLASGNIQYIYDATGVKLKKIVSTGTTTKYAGNYIYEDTGSGDALKFFNHPEGYVEPDGSGYDYVYQYKDHLGNIRLSYKNDDAVTPINIDDDFNSSTDGWSTPGTGSVNNTNQKLNVSIANKWNKTGKYLTVTPNIPLHIEFDFEEGNMEITTFFVKERINGVWESNANRDYISNIQDGHHEIDLVLTGDYIWIYFEKGSSTDDATLTTCYVDNFKLTQNGLEIQEENNYYPFGLKHKGYNGNISGVDHKYGFGGKEEQDDNVGGSQLNWLDFGARNYDAALGRWMNLDPLAENYYEWSPYNYAFNSPIIFVDPDGLGPIYDKDGNIIGYEVEEGQGPSQIAEDLNTIGLQAEVTHMDIVNSNPEKFEHIEDVTDINDEGFKELDINTGDIISVDTVIDRENSITEDKKIDGEISDLETESEASVSAKDKLNNQIDSLQNEWMKIEKDPLNYQEKSGIEPGGGFTLYRIFKQTPIELKQSKKKKQVDSIDKIIKKQKQKKDSLINLKDN